MCFRVGGPVTLFTYVASGGPVMIPIVFGSVAALAIVLERVAALRRSRVLPANFAEAVLAGVRDGQWSGAREAARADHVAGRVISALLEGEGRSRAERVERAETTARREMAGLERGLGLLSVIATVEPLLGLLGTVGGMIVTFEILAVDGVGTASNLAGGISQALVTTFGGLAVAIPAVVVHRLFVDHIDSRMGEIERLAEQVLDGLLGR